MYASGNTGNVGETITLIKYDHLTKEESTIEISNINAFTVEERNSLGWKPDDFSISSIVGDDNRTQITNTTAHPYYAIAYVSVKFTDGSSYGSTGYMVSPNVLYALVMP
ncbi:hypothetical protein [Abyssisolibacter fermentans]|uniref:hypothetical protein n=1 Tax=Abyssisolibacter fermentans TaxID=1766203 RepID=UPI0012E3791F|nr:hypothetical protein [Abyssisolibacter fermentans]